MRITLLRLILIALASLPLAGCATWHSSAQIGPNLKPHLGTSVSVPLGK